MEFENNTNFFQEDWNDVQYIKNELLEGNIDPWDKIILVYLAYMGYQNFQLANKSYQIIQKSSVEIPFTQQFMIYFLLFYSMNNIHTSYRYFLFKTYSIHPEVAKRIYQKFNKYFDYFKPDESYKPRGRYYESDSDNEVDEADDLGERLVREQMNYYYQSGDNN